MAAPGPGVKEEGPEVAVETKEAQPASAVSPGGVRKLVPHPTLNTDNLRDEVLDVATRELDEFQNVWIFLNAHHLHNPVQFAEDLEKAFPRQPDLHYLPNYKLPPSSEEFLLHLSDFSWAPESSSRSAPFRSQTLLLLDEFLTNTFVTEGDPLLLSQSSDPERQYQWTTFVKGSARSGAALFLCSLCLKYHWDLSVLHPGLQKSLTVIRCKHASCGSDRCSIALENARLSARGSLRKFLADVRCHFV